MEKLVVSSPSIAQRLRRVLANIAADRRLANETRYVPPVIWRGGMRLQPTLRWARPSKRVAQDDGRPKGMSGRQWKRLQKAEHTLARNTHLDNPTLGLVERTVAMKRIHAAHASCDKPNPGAKFRASGGQRRLRVVEYER